MRSVAAADVGNATVQVDSGILPKCSGIPPFKKMVALRRVRSLLMLQDSTALHAHGRWQGQVRLCTRELTLSSPLSGCRPPGCLGKQPPGPCCPALLTESRRREAVRCQVAGVNLGQHESPFGLQAKLLQQGATREQVLPNPACEAMGIGRSSLALHPGEGRWNFPCARANVVLMIHAMRTKSPLPAVVTAASGSGNGCVSVGLGGNQLRSCPAGFYLCLLMRFLYE